jgi:hypothetical protein
MSSWEQRVRTQLACEFDDDIRRKTRTQLTLVYLRTHTLQDAAARGIDVPERPDPLSGSWVHSL